jgi:hypothetical protein
MKMADDCEYSNLGELDTDKEDPEMTSSGHAKCAYNM